MSLCDFILPNAFSCNWVNLLNLRTVHITSVWLSCLQISSSRLWCLFLHACPAAVWRHRVWKWICGSGRRVWLWTKRSEFTWYLDSTQITSVFYTSILYTPKVFSCVFCVYYRSALKSAVKSVLCLTVLTAATDPAARTHVWWESYSYYFLNIYCMCVYSYMHNKYTQYTHIYYVNKKIFWMRLITINRLTALDCCGCTLNTIKQTYFQ